MERKIELSKKQFEFINKTERIGLLSAGLGAGKSYILALWIIKKLLENPGAVGVMSSKDYGQLMLALNSEVELILQLMGLREGTHYEKVKSPKLKYTFSNGSSLLGLSAKNYDSSFRGININFLAMDEVAFYDKEAFQAALGRVRRTPNQIRCASTPQSFNFLWEYFVESPPKDSFVIKATTYDNELLPLDYIESLKEAYPEKLFRQECLAEFIDLTSESAYYGFNKDLHVGNVVQTRGPMIYAALDFNVSPYCGIFFQVIDNKIRVFDELHIADNGDTYKAAAIILERYGTEVNVISDSTGSNRSTVGPSNHTILRNAGFKLVHSRNPFVFDRVQHVNKFLEDGNLLVDHKCVNLVRCLSKTVWGKSGKLDQTKDRTLTHASDALGYAIFKLFPPRGKHKSVLRLS